jgi:hypothetical protein
MLKDQPQPDPPAEDARRLRLELAARMEKESGRAPDDEEIKAKLAAVPAVYQITSHLHAAQQTKLARDASNLASPQTAFDNMMGVPGEPDEVAPTARPQTTETQTIPLPESLYHAELIDATLRVGEQTDEITARLREENARLKEQIQSLKRQRTDSEEQ